MVNFSEEAIFKIFAMDIDAHLLLFLSEKMDNSEALAEFEEAAEENKIQAAKKSQPRVLFVTVYVDQAESKVLGFFGVNETMCPRIILIHTKEEFSFKFLYRD